MAGKMQILSPFDNLVIQRERLDAIFAFDYQIECYVPAAKRKHGYFCLPLLHGSDLVGRLDAKAHRKAQRLELLCVQFDDAKRAPVLAQALGTALGPFLAFQQCNELSFANSVDKQTARHVLATFSA